MARIFISYRRADSRQVTGRIYDRLETVFGRQNVFKDVDNIPLGRDFRGVLREATANCEVMLVIIGRNWVNVTDKNGNRRLDDPADFVRIEVETGLQRDDTLVIPVLVENATMPSANELPDTLKELAYNNAIQVGDDPNFHRDMDRLISHLKNHLSNAVPDVDLPTSQVSTAGQQKTQVVQKSSGLKQQSFVGAGAFIIILAVIGILSILLIPSIVSQNPGFFGFGSDDTLTPSNTPTESVTPTPSITPTASDTPGIATIVAALDATATSDRATAYYQETLSARATEYAIGTQNIVDATATATLWTDTPTPNMTASIVAYRTQQAGTATQTWIDSWTDTPTATSTPTETLTPLESAINRAISFTGNNDDWQPFSTTFDDDPTDTEMMLVPAGCFVIGSDDGDSDELSGNRICFDEPFWIDRYEVTNEQYGSTGCEDTSSQPEQPRNCVAWSDALAHCEMRGGSLPTEAQWEYAARGVDNLIYPWGNEFAPNNAVYSGNSNGLTAPVASRPAGASWVGAYDMSGNLWEWTHSIYEDYPYLPMDGREDIYDSYSERVLRGGSFSSNLNDLRSANRLRYLSDSGIYSSGFRCARSVE